MTDIPILFSAPMVRALIEDRKTMTRRLAWKDGPYTRKPSPWQRVRPGDWLWVRETFSGPNRLTGLKPSDWNPPDIGWKSVPIWYWADGNPLDGDWTRPKPGIHMPRWASRITLVVTGVKIERLQDIIRGDAMAEGCPFPNMAAGPNPRDWFRDLWRDINGADSWDANPEVVAISFSIQHHNIDRPIANMGEPT